MSKKSGKSETSGKKPGKKQARTTPPAEQTAPAETLATLWPALERGEEKAVHEARKLTRKAAAEANVAGASRKTRRAWRDLRRAIAPLRDRDAARAHLLDALAELKVPEADVAAFRTAWDAQREAQFAALRLPKPPADIKLPKEFKKQVCASLREQAQALLDAAPGVLASRTSGVWHEWRKALKAYRYTLEAGSMQTGRKAPSAVTDLLDDLGRLQDAEVVGELLTGEGWLEAHRPALLAREKKAGAAARKAARRHWPALEAHLRETLNTPAN